MYFIAALSRSIPEALHGFVHRGSLLNATKEVDLGIAKKWGKGELLLKL